jgi:DnaJ-class molecular chaperone
MIIRDEGMPRLSNSAKHGNLHVHFVVTFPSSLTQEQKDGFAKIL